MCSKRVGFTNHLGDFCDHSTRVRGAIRPPAHKRIQTERLGVVAKARWKPPIPLPAGHSGEFVLLSRYHSKVALFHCYGSEYPCEERKRFRLTAIPSVGKRWGGGGLWGVCCRSVASCLRSPSRLSLLQVRCRFATPFPLQFFRASRRCTRPRAESPSYFY